MNMKFTSNIDTVIHTVIIDITSRSVNVYIHMSSRIRMNISARITIDDIGNINIEKVCLGYVSIGSRVCLGWVCLRCASGASGTLGVYLGCA